jgi:hypothetical protein
MLKVTWKLGSPSPATLNELYLYKRNYLHTHNSLANQTAPVLELSPKIVVISRAPSRATLTLIT